MHAVDVSRLLGLGALWKFAGHRPSGAALVNALDSDDDDIRTIAASSLLWAGQRSEHLIREALEDGQERANLVYVLASFANPDLSSIFEKLLGDPDPDVAQAAKDALRQLKGLTAA